MRVTPTAPRPRGAATASAAWRGWRVTVIPRTQARSSSSPPAAANTASSAKSRSSARCRPSERRSRCRCTEATSRHHWPGEGFVGRTIPQTESGLPFTFLSPGTLTSSPASNPAANGSSAATGRARHRPAGGRWASGPTGCARSSPGGSTSASSAGWTRGGSSQPPTSARGHHLLVRHGDDLVRHGRRTARTVRLRHDGRSLEPRRPRALPAATHAGRGSSPGSRATRPSKRRERCASATTAASQLPTPRRSTRPTTACGWPARPDAN